MKRHLTNILLTGLLAVSCVGGYQDAALSGDALSMYPDYAGTIIPPNIAPINFAVLNEADRCAAVFSGNGESFCVKGPVVRIPEKKWKKLLELSRGSSFNVDVYTRKDGAWKRHETVTIDVAEEDIDPYITYRLIEPGYSNYGFISLRQRDLTSFDESDLYNNAIERQRVQQQCINCHSFQNYDPDVFQVHARHLDGGTVVVDDREGKKMNLKTADLISSAVYPSWHPEEKLIAYSVNATSQIFHTRGNQKTEVFDGKSDLVLYDVEKDEVSYIVNDSLSMETFPYWSHDGNTLYYASAYLPGFGADSSTDVTGMTDRIRYDIWSIPFDRSTRTFGEPSLIFDAASDSLSAVTPRPSPDGRYLLSGVGEFGSFHIWHESGDIYLTDLQTGETRPLDEINSPRADSFKCWSSNSRWIAFTSRREDGSYTRLYFSYFDKDGHAHKPFILPQKDPGLNHRFTLSYNVPEFTSGKTSWTPKQIASLIRSEAGEAVFAE
ncbi:MAG: hypothetical protein MJY72_02825 [Bacteroidales bacterium]|nr:hypothetical protein [Bacteroidales bacterium]